MLALTYPPGEHERAGQIAEAIAPTLAAVRAPSARLADSALCRGLCAVVRSGSSSHARSWRRIARRRLRQLRQLRAWEKHGPTSAIWSCSSRRSSRACAATALHGYQDAAHHAGTQQHVRPLGLTHERSAVLLRANGRARRRTRCARRSPRTGSGTGRKLAQLADRGEETL